jgi:hypothetical protein
MVAVSTTRPKVWAQRKKKKLLDELYDSEDWPDEFFSKKGFEEVDSRSYIIGAVDIESV